MIGNADSNAIGNACSLLSHRYFNGGPPAETDFGGDVSSLILLSTLI